MLVEPSHDQGCQNKNKVESTQTRGKKDKKRSVPSECDCPGVLSNEELASSGAGLGKSENDCTGRDASSGAEVVPLTPLGTPLHLSTGLGPAPGTGLQFVPSTLVSSPHLQFAPFQVGTGSVPLQYNHLSTLGVGQAVGNQPVTSQTAAAVAAQQLQVIGSSGVSTSSSSITNTSGGPAGAAVPHSSKSQVKKILLHSPQLGVPAGDSGGQQRGPPLGPLLHGSPTTLPAGQQVAQPPSVSQPSTKKSKKQVRVTGNKQEREGHFNLPDASSTASSQDAATHHQPVTAGIPLDPGAQGVVYANTHTMAHFPATMAPPSGTLPLSSGTVNSFGQGLHPNESGLMVATPAAPAKILNDQLSEMITAPSPQVGGGQLGVGGVPVSVGVPYMSGDGSVPYTGPAGIGPGGVCHYPPHLVDVDIETDSNHDTALTLACAGGHEELVQLLLNRGANIEHRDKKGFTPLILAATAGHAKVVETLLNAGAHIEAQSERTKDTPLSLACSGGRYEVVEILLQRGANKEHRNVSDYTPLSLAASGGFVNIIKLLLDNGAEINSRTGSKLGISPLMLAAMNGHATAVKLLLDMGSDINAQIETNRNTALTLACFQGRHEVVSLLLDRKANVEHRAKTGLTPLMEAASGGYVEVGRVLLEKGADVNAPPVPSSKDTALTIAADKGHYKFVELLIQRGAQVEVKNKKGNSPLWLAANGGHLEVVQLLNSATADIESEDNRKVSCLMAAFKRGHYKVVKYMVRNVTQFPSDLELQRYIATIADKELMTKCTNCMEVIRAAKEKQALEANKNASILLEELEKERNKEESKKAAASRRRLKKKAKKYERRVEKRRSDFPKGSDSGDNYDGEDENENVINEDQEIKQQQTKKEKNETNNLQRVEQVVPEEKDGDSGIDSNSQTSATSETKVTEDKEKTGKKSKKKKKENKEISNTHQKQNSTSPPVPVTETIEVKKSSLNSTSAGSTTLQQLQQQQQQHSSASSTNTSKSKKKKEEENKANETMNELDIFHLESLKLVNNKKVTHDSSRVNALDTFGEVDHYVTPIPGLVGSSSTTLSAPSLSPNTKTAPGLGTSPKKGNRREDGWKEVSRKAKKVSVPNSAISRVIGRGGCNINTIREVSGAHIEVEKQGKSQGDRMISIKGSTEATRQAQNLISALVKDPDKDLSELLPKSVAKVAPKPSKNSAESAVSQAPSSKALRPASTIGISMATVTSSTTSVTVAKCGATTTTAWSSAVSSPKRTPAQVRPVSTIGPLNCAVPKSPAVRQLFPGEKKSVPTTSANKVPNTNNSAIVAMTSDVTQMFATKLADAKGSGKSATPPLVGSPNPSQAHQGLANNATNSSEGIVSEEKGLPETNNNGMVGQQYSIFNNRLSQVTHEAMWGAKEKQVNFASVAASGLPNGNKHQNQLNQQHLSNGPVSSYLDQIEQPPVVDASRAPGYRGTTSTITASSHSHVTAVASGSPPGSIPVPMPLSGSHQPLTTSMARSAPGTPVASPSMRPIAPPATRQTSTPPPIPRSSLDMGGTGSFSILAGPSRTPPPMLSSMVRIPSMPSASLGPGAPLSNRGHLSHSGMNMMQQGYSGASMASLAPGGPVSSIPRGPVPPPDHSDLVNLAPGQPYRKPPPPLEIIGPFHQQKVQQQFSSLAQLTGMMNGPRFTTPQTNTHPVFTNNILAPISAAPQIQSNLNPNAPDFTSRSGTFVPPTFPPRTQLAAFQNGAPTVTPSIGSGFSAMNQFPGGLDANLSLSGGFGEVIGGLLPRNPPPIAPIPTTMAANNTYRNSGASQDSSPPLNSPHSSNPASPTQSAAAATTGGIAQQPEERPSKLQPIGTERAQRAQKRSEHGGVVGGVSGGFGVVGSDMWPMHLPEMLAPPPLEHNLPANPYYGDLDMTQYGHGHGHGQLWNWGDMNQQM